MNPAQSPTSASASTLPAATAAKGNKSESDLLVDRTGDQCQKTSRQLKGANSSCTVGSSRSLPRSAAGLIRAKMAAAASSGDVADGKGPTSPENQLASNVSFTSTCFAIVTV
jgi:hypothetical protein